MNARLLTGYVMAAIIALAIVGGARPAAAQVPAAPTQQPSPAAILLAKQIIELKGIKLLIDPLVRGVIEKVKDQYLETNLMWQKDFDSVAAKMEKEYAPRADELVDASARIYASHFTEPELRQLLTFYQSPLGRKMIVEEPKALNESMNSSGQWADSFAVEVQAKMRAEMKMLGHDI